MSVKVLAKRGTAAQIEGAASSVQTAGEIAFATDTKEFYVSDGTQFNKITDLESNGNFYVDGNVGIGTTSPSSALQVVGDGQGDGILVSTVDGYNVGRIYNNNSNAFPVGSLTLSYGNTTPAFINAESNGVTIRGGATDTAGNNIKFRLYTSEQMRLTPTGLGIGTTSPAEKLHVLGLGKFEVTGTGYGNQALNLYNPDGSTTQVGGVSFRLQSGDFYSQFEAYHKSTGAGQGIAQFGTYDTNSRIVLYSGNSQQQLENSFYKLVVNSNTAAYVTSTGNVGIGTTSPATPLDVSGTITVRNSSSLLKRYESTWTTNPTTDVLYNSWTSGTSDYVVLRSQGNQTSQGAFVASRNGAFFGQHGSTGAITDSSTAPLSTTWARIADTSFFNGNVGIGTTSPTEKLHVNGNLKFIGSRSISTTGSSDNLSIIPERFLNLGTQASDKVYIGRAASWVGGEVVLQAGAANTMVVTDNKVGIGTTSPGSPLTVAGRVDFQNDLRLRGTDSAANQGVTRFYINSDNKFHIDTANDGNNLFVIDSGGKVGIGTASPYQTLTVAGNITQTDNSYLISTRKITARDAAGLSLYNDGGQGIDIKDNNNVIVTSGNVGIGTTSPGRKLTVVGTDNLLFLDSSGNSYVTIDRSATDRRSALVFSTAGDGTSNIPNNINWALGTADSDEVGDGTGFFIGTNTAATSAKLFINSSGNVGIGTTSPSEKLHVAGNAIVQNYIYAGDGVQHWGDGGTGMNFPSNDNIDFLTTSSSRVRITSTGNVGIGTTSPSEKLHVSDGGNIRVDGSEIYITQASSSRKPVRLHQAAYKGAVTLQRDGVDKVNISSDLTYQGHTYFNGDSVNVGIGTINPTAELHVEASNQSDVLLKSTGSSSVFTADGFVNSVFAMKENGTLKSEFFYDSINNQMKIRTSSAESLSLGVNNGQNIFIRGSDGNVGIGTTAPSTKLEISDSSYVDLLGLTRNGVNTANLRVGNLGSGDIALDVRLPTTDSRLAVRGAMSVGSGYADSANTGIANGLVVQGNVGIGTNSPGTELHVSAGDAIITAEGSNASYINGAIQLISNHASSLRGLGTFYYIAHTDVEWFAGLPYNNNDAFVINRNTNYTTPSSQTVPPGKGASQGRLLTLDSTGRLGIGTSVPAAELDVNGSIKLSADSSIFSDGSITIGIDYNNNQTDRVFKVVANDTTEVFRVQEDGKVGIGTTSLSYAFNVNSGVAETVGFFKSTDSRARILISDDDTNTYVGSENGYGFFGGQAGLSAGNLVINSTNGNVGIGTTSPHATALLDVSSTTKGVLFPRMTETQRDAMEEPATGLIVYQTDSEEGLYIYKSTGWTQII